MPSHIGFFAVASPAMKKKSAKTITKPRSSIFHNFLFISSPPFLEVLFAISLVGQGYIFFSFFEIIIGVFLQIPARLPLPRKRDEKRFELPTLKILLPLYAIYLILVAVWPTTLPFHDWQSTDIITDQG
jgi:hypothetical protein